MKPETKSRLYSLDALRGLVMIIMALDHVRDFFHSSAMIFPPENLARTTPILFFTRWITHFCAPVFMFASGMGAFLWAQRHGSASRFLWTRGLWLIVLEITVMRVAFYFSFSLQYPVLLVVFWALGCSMIVLAVLSRLPLRLLAVVSVATILLHNAFDGLTRGGPLLTVLHRQGPVVMGSTVVLVAYPLVPWFAVMAGGYCFGQVFLLPPDARRRILLRTGSAMTVAFFVLRGINMYGDASKWSAKVYPVLSFLNCTKYPPSLDFLLMTLGPALLCLAWFDGLEWRPANPLIVFGRVPLFYFVIHFFAAHGLMVAMSAIRYGHASFLFGPFPNMGGDRKVFPPDFGFDLWVVYVMWALIVIGLYPLCRWFAGVKARRRDWWLSYL